MACCGMSRPANVSVGKNLSGTQTNLDYTVLIFVVSPMANQRDVRHEVQPAPSTTDGPCEINASIYRELRRIASAKMHGERGNHTLQPTALVHEAFVRLADEPKSAWVDRSRILGLAARAMRNILVDHARARSAGKRGAGAIQVTLDQGLIESGGALVDVLAVDEALTRLAEFDSRQARVLELHFFGGLTFDEIAIELDVSTRTVKNDWRMARAWLYQQLAN